MSCRTFRRSLCALLFLVPSFAPAAESIWLEAEHLDGLKGYCWPMGRPEMKKTAGHWGIAGPGWAAEWNQGGESGFLSIAAGPDDDQARATKAIEIPIDGKYFVWVRYGDWREKPEPFQVKLQQPGMEVVLRYGETAVVEEDNEMKLYFGWAFAWDRREANLKKGPATLTLQTTSKAPEARQVDIVVLTTDAAFRPRIKDRPANPTWDVLAEYRKSLRDLEPLSRNRPTGELPAPWKLRTFQDKGFRYLWNVSAEPPSNWLSADPMRVLTPYNVGDEESRKEFEKKYAGRADAPIFSDPRITPTFHGVGPIIFETDPKTGDLLDKGTRFAKWLDAHPERMWATMMNYAAEKPIAAKGVEQFQKYRHRYVGAIAGESLGYFEVDPKKMADATAGVTSRRQLAEIFTRLSLEANREKYRKVYGKDLDANPYGDVIPCLSVGNILWTPLTFQWGGRTAGYESAATCNSLLPMRWAFTRGAARQWEGLTATYRSCNFGDSATIFTRQQSYTTPQAVFDNYYSVYSGAGMTWYKFDIWYQYMAGSSMFYHEQGFDEYWKPGGTTAAGVREVQLSPKGQLVDRFLRTTARDFDRGHPFTPVAFLVDYAHGWEPAPYWPNAFKNYHNDPDRFRPAEHEAMLQEYFWTAWYPMGPISQTPTTGTSEVNVAGVFGDIFDVIYAYPQVERWRTIDTYPVVIVAGDIELTLAEGQRLAKYVQDGGTLLVADAHLTGPGVAALELPKTGPEAEADRYRWLRDPTNHPSPRFRYRSVEGGTPLATTTDGKVFCTAQDRGKGRLVYLAVPRGLGITRTAIPVVARLFAHLSRGLMPVEVEGEVEWLVNRTSAGWMVTLINPYGQAKPQQGITPTDYRENRTATIRAKLPITTARDRLLPEDKLEVKDGTVTVEVSAGGVRVVELR